MDYQQLRALVASNASTTLFALRMREACHLPPPARAVGQVRDRDAKHRKYAGARKLMKQRHGVRL